MEGALHSKKIPLNKKSLAATAGNFRCLASLLKLLPQFCLTAHSLTFPPRLYHKKYLNKKKSGSYRWQPSLPSESAKIAVAILPYGSHPHLPTTTKFSLNKKKSGSYLLSHHEGSIIGVRELDFRVRDGNGYCLSTMATRHLLQYLVGYSLFSISTSATYNPFSEKYF